LGIVFFINRRRKRNSVKRESEQNSISLIESPKQYKYKTITQLHEITIGKKLGGGNYGEVYLGNWNGTDVALKKMKNNEDFISFEKEASVLMTLGNHPFIVQFLGKYISGNDQYIVTEYVQMGSLSDFLTKNKKTLTFADLFHMIWTAAKGMAFLEKKKIVHRDLAARNFLVNQINGKFCVKISDFGMSREADQNYYKSSSYELPIRWCAPEVLTNRKFTSSSDVWSFAVAVWEILSFGLLPYYWLNNKDIAEKIVNENERLKKPSNCPDELWAILTPCFGDDPANRPTFQQLLQSLNVLNEEFKIVDAPPQQQESDQDPSAVYNFLNEGFRLVPQQQQESDQEPSAVYNSVM